MKKLAGITFGTLLVAGIAAGAFFAVSTNESANASSSANLESPLSGRELAQAAPSPVPFAAADDSAPAPVSSSSDVSAPATSETVTAEQAAKAPETTEVSGHLLNADGTSATAGVVYFVFQNRLNEISHTSPLEKAKSMAEAAVAVDEEGSFTLKMKPGNFAMIYDPAATEAPEGPGPDSMAVVRRLTREQVQGRIAAIKENALQGLPISNGKIGDAFVIENRYVRPPVSNFGDMQVQSKAVATVKALDEAGELINFPATLRLRGKNGDIMEPHTPSVSKRAQYEFHDIMPQSYQVFALGTLPRPGAGDSLSTPTVTNDQFVFIGEPLTHEVVVKQPSEK
jgi:hypothetical protein